jgi:hypothetical protein
MVLKSDNRDVLFFPIPICADVGIETADQKSIRKRLTRTGAKDRKRAGYSETFAADGFNLAIFWEMWAWVKTHQNPLRP